jgi:hypothetical protein
LTLLPAEPDWPRGGVADVDRPVVLSVAGGLVVLDPLGVPVDDPDDDPGVVIAPPAPGVVGEAPGVAGPDGVDGEGDVCDGVVDWDPDV